MVIPLSPKQYEKEHFFGAHLFKVTQARTQIPARPPPPTPRRSWRSSSWARRRCEFPGCLHGPSDGGLICDMYIYMCLYMYLRMCISIYTHIYRYIYTYIHIYIHIYIYTCTYVYVHVYIYTTYPSLCSYTYMYKYTVYIHVCVYIYIYICVIAQ